MADEKTNIAAVQTFEYSADKLQLNPLLKQTIKRVISIDSQYRDKNIYSLSTNFTFDLSEPLRDVVSLKLYSIQVPYSWYTISQSYGSNFFYLKGTTDGINNGQHDYQVIIPVGNYDQPTLETAVNTAITSTKATYPDVSFGTTNLSYDSTNTKATLTVDIQKTYTEAYYDVSFSTWSPSINDDLSGTDLNDYRLTTIPSYLGFNQQQYQPYSIFSDQTYVTTPIFNTDNGIFVLDESNNYFTVIQYLGPLEYTTITTLLTHSSTIINTYKINLNQIGNYNRATLTSFINNAITNSELFTSDSGITHIDISNVQIYNNGNTYYKLNLIFNRNIVQYQPQSKMHIQFPIENIPPTGYGSVWTQTPLYNSCFFFNKYEYEPCNIISEISPVASTVIVDTSSSIILTCINPPEYTNNIANNLTIPITPGKYPLNQLIAQINADIMSRSSGFLNMQNTGCNITDTLFNLNIDTNKTFTENSYTITVDENSILVQNLGITPGIYDLNTQSYLDGSFNIASSYNFDTTALLTFGPNGDNSGNSQDIFRNAFTDGKLVSFGIYTQMFSYIEKQFFNYTYTVTNTNNSPPTIQNIAPFYAKITSSLRPNSSTLDISLNLKITNTLSYQYYDISFIDGVYDISNVRNLWNQLGLSSSNYKLLDFPNNNNYATIIGTNQVSQNNITLYDNSNNYFYINPYPTTISGAYTSSNANNIRITIPAEIQGTFYTNSTLLDAINTAFDSNPQTFGSKITNIVINNEEFTQLRININKIYTSADYNLVFYDATSFVRCSIGSQSVQNVTWDSTLGWILGFRDYVNYDLIQSNQTYNAISEKYYYLSSSQGNYQYNIFYDTSQNQTQNIINNPAPQLALATRSIVKLTGDTSVNTNLYNYFLISLDDYIQNHLNDGLVTVTRPSSIIPKPSFANLSTQICDPASQTPVNIQQQQAGQSTNNLTNTQLYSLNQAILSQQNLVQTYSSGPFIQDLFGIIPVKQGKSGDVYTEFGGSLQNQERLYFGPVNIRKLTIKLLTDRGDIINLNKADWSFSFICEQLYKSTSS